MLGWLALVVAALTGLFVFFQSHSESFDPGLAGVTGPGMTATAAVMSLLAVLFFVSIRFRSFDGRRIYLLTAACLVLAVCTGAWWYGKMGVVSKIIGGPSSPEMEQVRREAHGAVSVLLRRNSDGNFVTQGQINGTDAALLVDTGASIVMLKPTDAERAGIDVKVLAFTVAVQTANGTVYAAPARVRSISVGLLKIEDVEVLVARPGSLNENLLGMSFLRRLASYDLTGDFLTLRE